MNRKGQEVESQVHWIFILIAGALIIGFFATIVVKQKAASEIALQGKVSQQLDAIFAGAQQSPGTLLRTPTPDIAVEFTCNDMLIGPAAQRLGQNIVYAASRIEGNELITWTLPFSAPFPIANILYVTGPDIRYYLIDNGDTKLWHTLNGSLDDPRAPPSLPEELTRNFDRLTPEDISSLRDRNNAHVRFIFVGDTTDPTSVDFSNFKDADFSVVQIAGSQATWYHKSSATGVSRIGSEGFYSFPMLYGAIFTLDVNNKVNDQSQERYNCVSNKLIDKLNLVAAIYYYKFNNILAEELAQSECAQYYKENKALKQLAGMDGSPITNWPGSNSLAIVSAIQAAKNQLESTNENLQRISCPLLY
jgi:hypothetical protein